MRYIPGVLPGISFNETGIGEYIELIVPVPQWVSAAYILVFGMKYVFIVHGTFFQKGGILFLTECFCQLWYTEVIISIIQCLGYHIYLAGHIAVSSISIQIDLTVGSSAGMFATGIRYHFVNGFVNGIPVFTYLFLIGRYHQGNFVGAFHDAGILNAGRSFTCPTGMSIHF